MRQVAIPVALGVFLYAATASGQSVASSVSVPRLINLSGTFRPADSQSPAPIETVRLALYADEVGGAALWEERQTLQLDTNGHYSVLLGQTQPDGIPLEVFVSGDARWLGLLWERPGEGEGPRVRVTSVPYALRSAEADTLGGRPASAYLLAPTETGAGAKPTAVQSAATQSTITPASVLGGTPNFLAKYVDSVDIGNSAVYEVGGAVGIGTSTPLDSLHVRFTNTTGAFTGYAVQNLGSTATSYSGMLFYDQNGALGQFQGFNNSTHEYRINNIASGGTINFMTGGTSRLQIRNNGEIFFGDDGLYIVRLRSPATDSIGLGAGYYGALTLTGQGNTAVGSWSMGQNSGGGTQNTGVGTAALMNLNTGWNNTALGWGAAQSLGSGTGNIAIGFDAGSSLSASANANIMIGHVGASTDIGVIRIGTPGSQNTFFAAGIRAAPTANNNAIPVVVDSAGQLGTISSSRRFKEDIQDMGETSRRLLQLRPVTFRYRQPFADGSKPIQYGLVAEEVDEVFPDLVAHAADGQVESVKYQLLDVLLLNEVQRQQEEIQRQHSEIQTLQQRLSTLEELLMKRR